MSREDGLWRESAHAKLNLVLEVRGRRPDGYHELFTIFDELEVHDDLSFVPGSRFELEVDGQGAAELPLGEENLVLRAARGFAALYPGSVPGRFHLYKRIPAGAGLGGGSSDAAAALRLLARQQGVSTEEPGLVALARELGADLAFFLVGERAWADGRGDRIHAAPFGPSFFYVLLCPGYPCPTPAVFQAYAGSLPARAGQDSVPLARAEALSPDGGGAESILQSLQLVDRYGSPCSGISNDLDKAAEHVAPALAQLRQRLSGESLPRFHLSGSGSTLFAVLRQEEQAEGIAAQLRRLLREWRQESFPGLGAEPAVLVTRSRFRGASC
ncbi:MAG: 4-(cytidine 5'-diphospho)-2-C-methyl-D-erythritol kinase [Planctomycetota bacterium]|nr:MAG: 4-(cytidine 5'-diphospho)-2-C-methyl-D-erythritol kinase [Planctomycetota bacterium]